MIGAVPKSLPAFENSAGTHPARVHPDLRRLFRVAQSSGSWQGEGVSPDILLIEWEPKQENGSTAMSARNRASSSRRSMFDFMAEECRARRIDPPLRSNGCSPAENGREASGDVPFLAIPLLITFCALS